MTTDRDDPELHGSLRQALGPTAAERALLDARVLGEARRFYGTQAPAPRRHSSFRLWVGRAAAGLLLALGAWVLARVWWGSEAPAPAGPAAPIGRGPDVDGSGRLDVLDALHLARSLAQGAERAEWDFNADGRVDRADADELAARAVRLGS